MKVITTDTGPLIHIEEVHATRAWDIFQQVHIPDVVIDEITISKKPGNQTLKKSIFKELISNRHIREISGSLGNDHRMSENDSLILAHAIQNRSDILLTDDLQLRSISKIKGIRPVGSAGILYLSFLKGIFEIDELFRILDDLYSDSSLYITRDIIRSEAIKDERRKRSNPD